MNRSVFDKVEAVFQRLKELLQCSGASPGHAAAVEQSISELSILINEIRMFTESLSGEVRRLLEKERISIKECAFAGVCREKEFRTLAENTPDLIARIDRQMRFLYINPALIRESGISGETFIGKKLDEIKWPTGVLRYWREFLERVFETGRQETTEFEYPVFRVRKYYHVRIVPEFASDGSVESALSIARDITDRKKAEDALRESENRLRLVFENSPDQFFQQDRDLRYVWFTDIQMPGGRKEILGRTDFDFFPPQEADRLAQIKRKVIQTGERARVETHFGIQGSERYFDAFYEPWRNPQGEIIGIVGYVRDITERKIAEKKLEESEKRYMELSITDALTGLHNLRHFYDRLRMEIERVNRYHCPLSLLMLDIDNFKALNDQYGHYEGDKVLKRAAEVITRYIRQVDSAYRYGGEEFTIILPETESEEAVHVAERIREGFKMENFSPLMDEKTHLTVSIGVASYCPKEDLVSFLRRADESMYIAKSQGKDRVFYQDKGGEGGFMM
ncbi:MAG: diguanylate cyclase [Syntrophales bacterium]